ncbi:hypothetical protein [Cylindrospermopsis raciborskii]|uniref:hypothetical protein n=1 Tax=Cylindrospermopsis raciborskii TaxID=77022 RepID=UPI003DA5BFE2
MSSGREERKDSERRVTRLYLTDLRERQNLSPNLTLLQLLGTNEEESGEIGKDRRISTDGFF